MRQVLLAILILTIGVKISTEDRVPENRYAHIKLAEQSEESKNENEDHKHSKLFNDDIYTTRTTASLPVEVDANPGNASNRQHAYSNFINKPHTPPPDKHLAF